jgi:hypothetical protein
MDLAVGGGRQPPAQLVGPTPAPTELKFWRGSGPVKEARASSLRSCCNPVRNNWTTAPVAVRVGSRRQVLTWRYSGVVGQAPLLQTNLLKLC